MASPVKFRTIRLFSHFKQEPKEYLNAIHSISYNGNNGDSNIDTKTQLFCWYNSAEYCTPR